MTDVRGPPLGPSCRSMQRTRGKLFREVKGSNYKTEGREGRSVMTFSAKPLPGVGDES